MEHRRKRVRHIPGFSRDGSSDSSELSEAPSEEEVVHASAQNGHSRENPKRTRRLPRKRWLDNDGQPAPVKNPALADLIKTETQSQSPVRRSARISDRAGTESCRPSTSVLSGSQNELVGRNSATAHLTPVPYPSSRFCKVLRIIAGLSSPRAQQKLVRAKPCVSPPVWAESRQELCEALPYYRSFQSGLYMHKRLAYGYLLEAFPAPRDVWADNGKVIISHGGGQCIKTTDTIGNKSEAVLAGDQSSTDPRVDTMIQAHQNRTPLILIAGEGYENLPWELGCAYVVLGWYWISAVWVEAEPVAKGIRAPAGRGYFHRYKVRFDWIQNQGDPWWIAQNEVSSPECGDRSSASNTTQNLDHAIVDKTLAQRIRIDSLCKVLECSRTFPLADKSRRIGVSSLIDQTTGLLTPPITPPDKYTQRLPPIVDITDSCSTCSSSSSDINDESQVNIEHGSEDEDEDEEMSSVDEDEEQPGAYLLDTTTAIGCSNYTNSSLSSRICPSCQQRSPEIYEEGWICLYPDCTQFWFLQTKIGFIPIAPGFHLNYRPNFLICVASPGGTEKLPYGVVPPLPVDFGAPGSSALTRGWVCENCGRANCRYRWEKWECINCSNVVNPMGSSDVINATSFDPIYPSFLGDARLNSSSRIMVSHRFILDVGLAIETYTFPHSQGVVHHVIPGDKFPADALWTEYQKAATSCDKPLFERRGLSAHTVKGQLLAQHFAVNCGAKYKYNVETMSLPFNESPDCMMAALYYISEVVRKTLDRDVEFNEILSMMYREGQKMSWHDDGEEGLGPVIASISLGSSATMSFRRKADRKQHNNVFHKPDKVAKPPTPATMLEFTLSHGDIVIMDGDRLQQGYSHRVIPHGFRVAATARDIHDEANDETKV